MSVDDLRQKRDGEQKWGIAAVMRGASIPYATESVVEDSTVATFVPMMFYQGERLFINGTEGGLNLYREQDWEVNALIRMHFIDIPSSFQNEIGGDTADYGFQYKYRWDENTYTDVELLTDPDGRLSSQFSIGGDYQYNDWRFLPKASLIWKDSDYNSYYYGLNLEDIDSGVDFKMGSAFSYHVTSNLYVVGGAYARYFDSNTRDAAFISDNWQGEGYLGFGFFNDAKKSRKSTISNKPYLRIAHGWATPSNIGEIFSGNTEKDEFNNQLTSVFYGHPLTDELFGLPLDIYLTPGYVWHWHSDVQSSTQEYVMAIKAYYTFTWPVQWRFGVAEGLSYVNRITYIEQSEMDRKGYEPSKLLNYLDFSFDVNLGDVFNHKPLDGVWLGYSLHHRSAIFESASQFGRIKGGSNYNTVYVQFDF
ncbi:MipA/OmpV family protein [Photobacterium sp. ZSDE20]|uniref:MipA/OmpV family protein n=1 Tax=Photobacterium pectinilyticum TaxID=2906793 RepID=A0ABT1N9Q2_9GAMM|nr:MipA/OmpV family protein [Photobacterium sp. ZSDE20]MCQ1060009.1 MipA/OmpV family protein [Photobacterium sp. ZSDE20]MDD1826853.1 MipA/OmpV family protein [Photobacterium sp. ZSDE20]